MPHFFGFGIGLLNALTTKNSWLSQDLSFYRGDQQHDRRRTANRN
jgi:hypothetical protein